MGWLLLRCWHHLPVLQHILVDVQACRDPPAIPHSYTATQPQAITLDRSLRYGAPAAS
jgi:hypothetical protein